MFVPPSWLTNLEVIQLGSAVLSTSYNIACWDFMDAVDNREWDLDILPDLDRSLSHFWSKIKANKGFLIAHGLLNPHYFGNIYCDALDSLYHGKNPRRTARNLFRF